jgi:hypothetical protein
MRKPLDPGPPLTPGNEFCESEPPNGFEYLKAAGAAGLVVAAGGALWFASALLTGKQWAFTGVVLGVAGGWVVHRAAGRHRSRAVGLMAGASTVLAVALGYGLLWLPFLNHNSANRQFSWYHLFMLGVGAFVAYQLAGPRVPSKSLRR